MGTDKVVEELAQKLYEESDTAGIKWSKRGEWLKDDWRDEARRRLGGAGHVAADQAHARPGEAL